ncbi:MAG: hypothetical protein ABEI39_05015 [Halobacteriales archaeon]
MESFRDLALAAYCPRKLYYARQAERDPPDGVAERREIAFRYPDLLDDPDALADAPIAVPPAEWRSNLGRARGREPWAALVDPVARDRVVTGKDCRGVVHKLLDWDGPVPGVVSAGEPPEEGVWESDTVRAVAAAKALSWEHGTEIERALVEYPAAGIVRTITLTTRRTAAYRRALRTVASMDRPPPRLRNDAKCGACEFRETCGVRTRSLGSLL